MNLGNTFPGLKQDKNGLNQGFMTLIFEINIKKTCKNCKFFKTCFTFWNKSSANPLKNEAFYGPKLREPQQQEAGSLSFLEDKV